MNMMGKEPGFEPEYVLEVFPWHDMAVKTFVDVGGSHGSIDMALTRVLPGIHCIVQDAPQVISKAQPKLPAELVDRVEFMPYDFFTEQPIKGADVYFFRWIFHDWPDKYCIKILKNLIPALKHGARIIINEFIVPKPGEVPVYQEQLVR